MKEWTPEDHIDIFLRVHRTIGLRMSKVFAEANAVPPSEARLLSFLSRAEDHRMRMEALSQEMGMTKSAVSRIVDRLERGGLVQRLNSSQDRRAIYATLTTEGRDALRHVTRVFRSIFDDVFLSGLNPEELDQMTALLFRLDQANRSYIAATGDVESPLAPT